LTLVVIEHIALPRIDRLRQETRGFQPKVCRAG
jgi:hypothetical protein